MTRVLRATAGIGVALLIVLGFGGVASAQDYPTGPVVVASPSQAPGSTQTIVGEGWTPGSTVTVSLGGEVLGTAVVGEDGTFSFTYTTPTTCGTYDLVITDGVDTVSGEIVVPCDAAGPAVTPSGTLPYTGSDSSLPLAQIGIGLVAVGGIAVLMVRKRQNARA